MPKSMTGYGAHEDQNNRWNYSWEIRSVNGKQLQVRWKLPPFLFAQQNVWEQVVRNHAARGRVDIFLKLEASSPEDMGVSFNTPLAQAMVNQVAKLALESNQSYIPDYNRLLTISHLWQDTAQDPDKELLEFLKTGLAHALDKWNQSRITEGEALAEDLSRRFKRLRSWTDDLKKRAPEVKETRFQQANERVMRIMEEAGVEVDEARLLQELVILADKLDVSEELTRLDSHLGQLSEIVNYPGDCGRKLDFILQEAFREINTCGNKIQDSKASTIVVDFKVELEKCREQVQNLE